MIAPAIVGAEKDVPEYRKRVPVLSKE